MGLIWTVLTGLGALGVMLAVATPLETTWEALPLTGSVSRVTTPASGVVLAWSGASPEATPPAVPAASTSTQLLRTDDGGATWEAIALPPSPQAGAVAGPPRQDVVIDPLDPSVLYATGAEGLYQSNDRGRTWRLLLPTTARILGVATTPAARGLLYLTLADDRQSYRAFRRSRDGGVTWEELSSSRIVPSRCARDLLVPHPTDAGEVLAIQCGGGPTAPVHRSTDQGATWTFTDLCPRPSSADCYGYVERLVVSPSRTAGRAYLTTVREGSTRRGSALLRSDDGGRTWAALLDGRDATPSVTLHGLAIDSTNPDRVYIARDDGTSAVRTSADGGATWTALGGDALGTIHDLALSGDGSSLYAATDRGLWRLQLAR